ncbi:hypothetical protein MTO96_043688, partial [Rhipicephalus appendiculatus]
MLVVPCVCTTLPIKWLRTIAGFCI